MVQHCYLCKKWSYSYPQLSFHRFPSDSRRKKEWLKSLKLENCEVPWAVVICSEHFKKNDYTLRVNKEYLKKTAIPMFYSSDAERDPEPGPSNVLQSKDEDCQSMASEISTNSSKTLTASETGSQKMDSFRNISDLEITPPKKRKRRTVERFSSSDFTSTPRKAKRLFKQMKTTLLNKKKKIRNLQQRNRRLRSRVNNLSSLVTVMKERQLISENAESTIMASLPTYSREIFNRMLKGSHSQKYTPELRSFALTLSFYSRKAYTFMRNTFNESLPHLNTISRWYQVVDGSPGWTVEAINALKIRVTEASKSGKKVICNLVLDEMSIRKQVEWTGKKFTGYGDIGSGITGDVEEAKEVLAFMLVSLNDYWKLPVGYFLLNGLCASEKASLVNHCLEYLSNSNVIVTSLTFDGAPVNFQMVKILGANLDEVENLSSFFLHPISKEKIFILDPCHMLKLVRNCLGEYKVLEDENKKVDWGYITKLVDFQCKEGLHAGNKIKKRHINYTKEKMKVRLATQVLSKSVADSLCYLAEDNEDFKASGATSRFILFFNHLFDIFNWRNRLVKYEFKKP